MGNVIASGGAKLTPAAWDKPQDTWQDTEIHVLGFCFLESQNTLCWKGPTRSIRSSPWPHRAAPKPYGWKQGPSTPSAPATQSCACCPWGRAFPKCSFMHSLIVSFVHPGHAAQNNDGMAELAASLQLSSHLSLQRSGGRPAVGGKTK